MKYRAEIDGLRALAVIPVILFHAGFELFSGGFVGVDVFFVISGYLITAILVEDIENNRFSLINFYERRARRILPALFFVMLVCIPFAWMWMLPSQMEDFSQSLVAVSLFVSNILFWTESGYFDAAAEEKPLLHTWSLAVEEQYYLLFPIFLFFAWRSGKNTVFWTIVVFAASSLALSEWGWRNEATANFYSAPTRAWEFFAGSIAAFIVQKRGVKANNTLSMLGLAAIVFAIFAYDESTPFPSVYALVPVVGVVFIVLFADKKTFVAKILSTKVFVGIGLISYSAYLWHQPLFAFTRIRLTNSPSEGLMLILSLMSLILAVMSWNFVEQPLRNRRKISGFWVLILSGFGLVLFVFLGVVGHMNNGFVGRFENITEYESTIHRVRGNYGLSEECEKRFVSSSECQTNKEPNILVWGDSYAMHIVPAIIADNPNARIQQATVSQCAPIIGYAFTTAIHGAKNCIDFNNQILEFLARQTSITHVVLSSPFARLVNNKSMLDVNGVVHGNGREITKEGIIDVIRKIRLMDKVPVLVTPPPVDGSDLGQCLVEKYLHGKDMRYCDFSETDILDRVKSAELFLASISEANLINLRSSICQNEVCVASHGKIFIFRDDGHLSYEGSEYIGKQLGIYQMIMEFE